MRLIKDGLREALRIARREPPLTPGSFDVAILPALLGKQDPVILEIGCNDGGQTRDFLRLFDQARIYAFEPDPRARQRFSAAVDDPRVALFDIAISDKTGRGPSI